jgi:hypothetical protein
MKKHILIILLAMTCISNVFAIRHKNCGIGASLSIDNAKRILRQNFNELTSNKILLHDIPEKKLERMRDSLDDVQIRCMDHDHKKCARRDFTLAYVNLHPNTRFKGVNICYNNASESVIKKIEGTCKLASIILHEVAHIQNISIVPALHRKGDQAYRIEEAAFKKCLELELSEEIVDGNSSSPRRRAKRLGTNNSSRVISF